MASSSGAAPGIPANVTAARKQVMTSDFFALCYLMLCNLAYAAEDSAQAAVKQITDRLPTMPVPNGKVAGKWSLSWGPCVKADDNSNLMYGAEFSDSASSSLTCGASSCATSGGGACPRVIAPCRSWPS